ncbi:MAG TPA: ABC transporter substrate-binding protein [Dongiaceae bacterium]
MKLTLTAVCAALALTAAVAAQADNAHPTKQLILGLNADIPSSNPGVDRDANADTVLLHVIEGLVAYKEDLTIGPMLAESWQVSDDGRTYTFKLRPGLKFHNGAPVTSADVAWSFARYVDPNTNWQCTYRFDGSYGPKIEKIDTPDELTTAFHLSRADGMFLTSLASTQCLGAVLHKDSLKADGTWDKPIGTGPYMFRDWQHDRYIDLARFPDYQSLPGERDGLTGAKIAYADELRFLVVPESAARESALYAGQIDIMADLPPNNLELARGKGVQVQPQPSMAWELLLTQTSDPLIGDVRIRQAIAHAIDLQTVADTTTFGLATANPSAVASMSPYFTDAEKVWPAYDPEKAKALLKEAGYDGAVIKLLTNKKYEEMYSNAVAIQSMLAQAGMNVELEVLDWAAHLDAYAQGKFQLSTFGYSARLDPALMYETFVCPKSVDPSCFWEDAAAVQMLTDMMTESDRGKRQAIFDRAHALMAEQVPVIGLYNDVLLIAVAGNVHGHSDWPGGTVRLWNVWKDQ